MSTTHDLAWEVRYQWRVAAGVVHPEYTFERRGSESQAIDCAVAAIERTEGDADLQVIRAYVKGPGQETWRSVE